jgi:hypothetical protein
LIQPEVGGTGHLLKHNLVKVLISSNTSGPRDLPLVDGDDGPDRAVS